MESIFSEQGKTQKDSVASFILYLNPFSFRKAVGILVSTSVLRFLYSPCGCVCVCAQPFSCVQFFATPWTVAHQAPLSVEFSSKNTGVSCHFLLQGNLPDPGIGPASLASPALADRIFITEPPENLGYIPDTTRGFPPHS